MKQKSKKERAVTLIALIITIIVLLILATISIQLLINGGIIQRANKGTEKYSDEEIMEQIKLSYSEWQTARWTENAGDAKDFLDVSLEKIYGTNKVTVDEETEGTFDITIEGRVKSYQYNSKTGEAGLAPEKWKQNEDGSFSKGEITGVQVGDIVHYETILNKPENTINNTQLAQLKTKLENYSGSKENPNIDRDSELIWKVLDIKNGKIRLINSNMASYGINIFGWIGYNNVVYFLDETCNTLYSVKGIGNATNLKIEDVEKHLKYDFKSYENLEVSPRIKYGETMEYTGIVYYPSIYSSEEGCIEIENTDNSGNMIWKSVQNDIVEVKYSRSNQLLVTQTAWKNSNMSPAVFNNSIYYKLFIKDDSNVFSYDLSSRCVHCKSDRIQFGSYVIRSERMDINKTAESCGESYVNGSWHRIRPVVTLNSDVQLSGNSTDGWTIQ